MDKPINLVYRELEEKLVKDIEESNIPIFLVKTIIEKIYNNVVLLDNDFYNKTKKEYEESLQKDKVDND